MPTIEVSQARIVGDHYTGKMQMFVTTSDGEKFLNAMKDKEGMNRLNYTGYPSRDNVRPEIGGQLFVSNWEIPEGTVMKVFAADENVPHGQLKKSAQQFFRLRADGPLNEIRVKIPSRVDDAYRPNWIVRGRFDLLTMDEGIALGATVPKGCEVFFTDSMHRNTLEIEELAPAKVRRPTTRTKVVGTGKKKRRMTVSVKRRKMRRRSVESCDSTE